ncbi:serine O-acetyltransferase [Gracilibacillus oryzae]|uniref:Serine acetyltransferase n=2 Tax=Gracilibacillus oryzae TaxID=1672701 RepID=A0A7C8KPZ3_9BACI|nr:serine O-acetyltransferase [Gracilibacillus oryzae]
MDPTGNVGLLKCIYNIWKKPSKKAIIIYRWAKKMHDKNYKHIPIFLTNKLVVNYGSFISLNANIGRNLDFRHINGIVIGDGVTIANNVVIYQQVTLGGKNLGDFQKGNYPSIEDGVTIFAGAKIIGNITVGANSIVGANSVVINDVPANSVVAGIPAKVVKKLSY